MEPLNIKKILVSLGGIVTALLSSACCVIPFILFTLGISGAWISNLTFLAPYKPYFIFLTFIFLSVGFFMVYRKNPAYCTPGSYCADPKSTRIAKVILWITTILVGLALVFPYLVKLFD